MKSSVLPASNPLRSVFVLPGSSRKSERIPHAGITYRLQLPMVSVVLSS
jgi:hypothetical protein